MSNGNNNKFKRKVEELELWKDKKVLKYLYYERDLTLEQVGKRLGMGGAAIRYWMKKKDLNTRSKSEAREEKYKDELWRDESWFRKRYLKESKSMRTMAEEAGCGIACISDWREEFGIEERVNVEKGLSLHPTVYTNVEGYELASSRVGNGNQKSIGIHRLVAVAEYGFDEVCDSVIHHKNEIPWDNRPENLQVMTNSDHASHHASLRDFDEDGFV